MVATFARLRLTLLRNTLLREKWRIILLVIGALYGLGLLLAAVSGLALLNAADDELRRLGRPQHDVDVLAADLVAHGGDAGAA